MTDVYVRNITQDRSAMSPAEQDLQQAFQHFHRGELEQADALCVKLLRQIPGHAEANNLLAAIALQVGRPDVAAGLLQQAIASDHRVREYHHNLGNVLRMLGRPDEAVACYQKSLAMDGWALDSLFELGITWSDLAVRDRAIAVFRALIAAMPEVAESYHRQAIQCLQQGANGDAILLARRALTIQPDLTDAHTNLGVLLREEDDFVAAQRHFAEAALLRPDDATCLANLAALYSETGKRALFAEIMHRALAIEPDQAEFHYSLAMGQSFSAGDRRLSGLKRLESILAGMDGTAQIKAHFAIAKAHEDLGDMTMSFDHQMMANRLKRTEITYDQDAALGHFARVIKIFSAERVAQWRDAIGERAAALDHAELPIFVLGMPRSGSSLIEQILASHPKAHGAGELLDLPTLARALGPDGGPYFPEYLEQMAVEEFIGLGRDYLRGLRARAPAKDRIVDKLPDNFRLIGLIHLALPRARIIHTRRDPIDSCLSIYSKLFTADIPYSYDLYELGRYWRCYEQVMAHWRAILPAGSFLEMDYEAIVADQEAETRKMLDFCGLDWDPACLQFHRTERVVRTASALQVRRPLYNSSVGRWRPSAEKLAPLLAGLEGR